MSQLNAILTKLLTGVETPIIRDQRSGNEAERLIEQIEIQNYPYPLLHCQHLEEKGIGEDCVECQQLQRETYQSRFELLTKEKGYEHTHTLKAAFDYYSTLITQYRLTECDALLDQIFSYCIERGSWSSFYIMGIQARAFLRFKQGQYQESLDYFNLQIEAIGPNEMIYENMALAYSRLEKFKEASICYAQAILLIRQKPPEQQQFATLLAGLSNVLDNIDDSLVVLDESMRLLKTRFDKPHSLMAKTLGAMGDLHMKRDDIATAEKCYQEAVRIFIDTCGYDTPLTANALNKYAKSLMQLDKKPEALAAFTEALQVWAKVDNESFEPNAIVEALMALMQQTKDSDKKENITDTGTILESLQKKIIDSPLLKNDINVICLLKFIYEIYVLRGEIPRATVCCRSFKDCLEQLDESTLGEFVSYRSKLLEETTFILQIMEKM